MVYSRADHICSQPWPTGTTADTEPKFDYSELEAAGIENLFQAQRVRHTYIQFFCS